MITERHEELAALYAFDLLEGAERSAFEAELAGNPELASYTRALRDSTVHLALAAPQVTPPPALKARILAAVEAPAPGSDVVPFSPFRLMPWGLAAALAVTTAWLLSHNLALQTENQALQTERQLAEVAYKAAQNQLNERSLLAEKMISHLGTQLRRSEDLARLKVSALASLAGNTKEAQAIAVWDPEQQSGLLTFDKMPVISEAQDYQIWVVDPAYPNPVNGGVFRVDENGRATLAFKPDQPVHAAAAFAISLEKKGGVPKAEGPIVLLGKVPTF
jgi:anti-sigma-K factor RskA